MRSIDEFPDDFEPVPHSPSKTKRAIIAYYQALEWAYSPLLEQLSRPPLLIQLNVNQVVLKKYFAPRRRWEVITTQPYLTFSPKVFTQALEARRL